jgi:DNA-binding LacI/PurR family transcriptional regulator
MGLAGGIGEALGESVSLQVIAPQAPGGDAAYRVMKEHLQEGEPVPDAILVALRNAMPGIRTALAEHGLRVPKDVSLVSTEKLAAQQENDGGDTLIHEPTVALSAQLMGMLFQRIENKGMSLPGTYLPAKFIGGQTTRSQENKLLGI